MHRSPEDDALLDAALRRLNATGGKTASGWVRARRTLAAILARRPAETRVVPPNRWPGAICPGDGPIWLRGKVRIGLLALTRLRLRQDAPLRERHREERRFLTATKEIAVLLGHQPELRGELPGMLRELAPAAGRRVARELARRATPRPASLHRTGVGIG